MEPDDARALLSHAQRLSDEARCEGTSVAGVAAAVVGLQAQDLHAASLGVRARLALSSASAVERERTQSRSVVRVWCMRGTLHLVAARDARWLVDLLGPVGLARGAKRRAQMGVSTPEAVAAVRRILGEHGPLTRHEVAARVRQRGVALADDRQMPVHLVACAALEGHVCEAGARDGEPAYALTDDWLGPRDRNPLKRDRALAELARRYMTAHPPAGPEDMAAWSGLGVTEARRAFAAIERELDAVRVLNRDVWVPRALSRDVVAPSARLLPAFDGLLLAHSGRSLTVSPAHAKAVLPGGGVLRPTVLVDGRVEGTWGLARSVPEITAFNELSDDARAALESERADVVRHRES